ncbi:hypothetical protein VTN77DRAFT_2920 [Rasamsonia byssochlamydoides]|uniref:uncharacterized protein n=1 Tax=Rasamsonia byssochlamydoides TaxID=89139 RepID=UPI00374411B1
MYRLNAVQCGVISPLVGEALPNAAIFSASSVILFFLPLPGSCLAVDLPEIAAVVLLCLGCSIVSSNCSLTLFVAVISMLSMRSVFSRRRLTRSFDYTYWMMAVRHKRRGSHRMQCAHIHLCVDKPLGHPGVGSKYRGRGLRKPFAPIVLNSRNKELLEEKESVGLATEGPQFNKYQNQDI